MRKFIIALALVTGTMFAGTAAAGPYVGLMWSEFDYSDNQATPKLKFAGPTLRLGASVGEWVSLEVRGGRTDSDELNGTKVRIKYWGSGLARLGFPRSDKRLVPYLLGGMTYLKFRGGGDSEDTTGLTFGVGVDLFADAHHGITVEWLRVDDEEDDVEYKIDHFGAGYTYRF